MHRFVCFLLTTILLTGLFQCNALANESEQVLLSVAECWTVHDDVVQDGQQLIAIDLEGGYQGLMRFDTHLLDAVGLFALRNAALEVRLQYLRRIDRDGVAPRLQIHALTKPFHEIVEKQRIELVSGEDYEAQPLAAVEVPIDVRAHDLIVIDLSHLTGDRLIETLRRGILLRLVATDATPILQVNMHGALPPHPYRASRPSISLGLVSERPKLDLHPRVRPEAGHYVTRRGEDFDYKGQPIRFFGFNIHAGGFDSYESIDNYVDRLRSMNINAVRLWATGHPFYTPESTARGEMVMATRGDGSKLDLYDYLVYRLQEAGLFIHNTTLDAHGPPMQHWPGIDIVLERKNKTGYDFAYYNVFPIMPYLHEGFFAAKIAHMRMYLNRVNPYTGQRYAEMPVFATWELANENHTVAYILEGRFHDWPEVFSRQLRERWNGWLAEQYVDRAGLIRAWGELDAEEDPVAGTVEPAPTYDEVDAYPDARARDFVRFVQHLFIESSRQLEAVARACAPEGVGINVAPIVANTHADLNLHAQYASSVLDFASVGAYQTPYTTDPDMPHYPWRPISSERPYFYNLNYQTIAGKPFVVYEHSFIRPYAYRAEWNPALALLGAGLGWDGMYFYFFGQNRGVCDERTSDLSFLDRSLAIPVGTHHDGYSLGFNHGNDEVLMASVALTAQAFVNGIQPNRESTTVTFGESAIHGPEYRSYSPKRAVAPVPSREMAGGEREWYVMPDIYRRFMHASVRRKLATAFDSQQTTPIRVDGDMPSVASLPEDDRAVLQPSDQIIWDPQNRRIVLDAPHSKIVVGFMREGYAFSDGVRVGPMNRDFAFVGISSRDGKPITESSDLILTVVSMSANTDYVFESDKIEGSVIGHIKGVVERGTVPVVVDRVATTIELPSVKGQLTCYNFARYCYRNEPVNGRVTFTADEPLFLARIRR